MARNYSLPTIKTLFAEADSCAYPHCDEPLVFRDRGRTTVVAEIAHIRSEKVDGPRFDPDYVGDIDGPDNLLLLCGKHHKPIDRHEAAYTIAELEMWKAAQRAAAGKGTPIGDDQARAFARLTDEERQTLKDIARAAQRIVTSARGAQSEIDAIRDANLEAQRSSAMRFGPVFQVDDAGNRSLIPWENIKLSGMEQHVWNEKARAAYDDGLRRVLSALATLEEELAVLRMYGGALAKGSARVVAAASGLVDSLGELAATERGAEGLTNAVAWLWQLANGETDLDD